MKKMMYLVVSILLLVMLSSCSSSKTNSNGQPQMLNVELAVKPEQGKVGQPITFEAKVTQGNDRVNDADEVQFEIWRAKDQQHEKIAIKHPKNGIYQLKKTFSQEGTYYIISHVTARGMHNMPKKEFIVGTPSEPEDPKANDSMNGMNMGDQKDKDHQSPSKDGH
jgi:hypothetical protein